VKRIAIAALATACGSHSSPDAAVDAGASVLELHGSPTRAGAYVAPNLTHATATGLHVDPTFVATYPGAAFAQALYYDGGGAGDLVIAASEMNVVTAFDATGQMVWQQTLGDPQPMPNPDEGAPCGDINPLGITGTPVIDYATRTLYLDAMIHEDNAAHHRIFALSLDDGSTKKGWPVDVGTAFAKAAIPFLPATQNQRGGLTLLHGHVYVPYGGHAGDCGNYHGWVVAVPTTDPAHPTAFTTTVQAAGAWMPGGVSSDGANVFAVFGNGSPTDTWADSEMVARFEDGAKLSGSDQDYWVPTNWQALDQGDIDLTGPAIVLDLPGATPAHLLIVTGKDGSLRLVDRTNLGGISDPVATLAVGSQIISVSALYTTNVATYVVVRSVGMMGCPGLTATSTLAAVRIDPGAPPQLSLAWCAGPGNVGSPIATTSDGVSDAIVWAIGAEGDQRLHGYHGDTGAEIFTGGGPGDAVTSTSRFISPMYAKGRIFIATDGQLYAFTTD